MEFWIPGPPLELGDLVHRQNLPLPWRTNLVPNLITQSHADGDVTNSDSIGSKSTSFLLGWKVHAVSDRENLVKFRAQHWVVLHAHCTYFVVVSIYKMTNNYIATKYTNHQGNKCTSRNLPVLSARWLASVYNSYITECSALEWTHWSNNCKLTIDQTKLKLKLVNARNFHTETILLCNIYIEKSHSLRDHKNRPPRHQLIGPVCPGPQ